jgi:hypothetical protein
MKLNVTETQRKFNVRFTAWLHPPPYAWNREIRKSKKLVWGLQAMNLLWFSGERIIEVRDSFNVADQDNQLGKGAGSPAHLQYLRVRQERAGVFASFYRTER